MPTCYRCGNDTLSLVYDLAKNTWLCTDTETCFKEMIWASLDNAALNNFDPLSYSVDENVKDLQRCDAHCEDLEDEQIRPHVEAYFRKHGKGYFAKDGTLMDADGNRSIFDDVDE